MKNFSLSLFVVAALLISNIIDKRKNKPHDQQMESSSAAGSAPGTIKVNGDRSGIEGTKTLWGLAYHPEKMSMTSSQWESKMYLCHGKRRKGWGEFFGFHFIESNI